MKNSGASPAFNHQFAAGVLYVAKDYTPANGGKIIEPVAGPESSMSVLAPSETHMAQTNTDEVWTDEMFRNVAGAVRTHKMIVVGLLAYQDVFRKPRETKFCFVAEFHRAADNGSPTGYRVTWHPTSYHNEAS